MGVCCGAALNTWPRGRCGCENERLVVGTVKNLLSWHPSLNARSLPSMPRCPLSEAAVSFGVGVLSGEE